MKITRSMCLNGKIFKHTMIRKSTVDNNVYLHKILSNGINVLLVQNPEFTKSSCALSVEVGSLDEPADCPGLAHFLEHMLFMGTKKYPGESMFSDFLSQHSGNSNAYTADEMTVYYCDVESSQLVQMADMFSSFFISPLFIGDAVQREISAVNSEYLNSLNCRGFRRSALLAEFMKDSVPEKRFSCGNSETLRQPDILERVSSFWKTKYSSSIMSLVVCGNGSIQSLEEAAELFASISNLHIKKKVPTHGIYDAKPREIFDKRFYSKIVQFAPLEEKKELHICMVLPHTRSYFRTNPLSYIEFLFTSRESGGLLSKLKSERLGFGLSFNYDHYNEYTRVGIDVDLTDKGSREHVRILGMVRAFLSTITADENEYKRLGRLEKEKFMYKQSESPLELAEGICPEMHHYPKENILDFDYLYDDFDPKLINFLLSLITDHTRWIVFLGDKNGVFESREKYYGVEYRVIGEFDPKNVPVDTFRKEALCAPDCFIENVELIDGQSRFIRTEQFQSGHICLVFDKKFKVPKSEVFIFLRSVDIEKEMVPLEIFLRLAEDAFNERHSRLLTNYHLSVESEVTGTGILIKFEGFTSKIIEVAKLFFNVMQNPPLDRFEVVRREVEDIYLETISQSPYLRAGEVFRGRIMKSMSSERLLEMARHVRKDEIKFLDSFYTEILAVGNIGYDDVFGLFSAIKSTGGRYNVEIDNEVESITFETNDKNNNLAAMFYRIDEEVSRDLEIEEVEDSDDSNQCASFTLSNRDIRSVSGRLIHQICHERFFRELRTQEELGYIVNASVWSFHSVEYLVFLVQSEKSVDFLESRINRFVCELIESIKTMCDEDFETFKESLITFYDEPLLNLEDFSNYVLSQYKRLHVDLLHNRKMIEAVGSLQRKDLIESGILDRCIRVSSTRK